MTDEEIRKRLKKENITSTNTENQKSLTQQMNERTVELQQANEKGFFSNLGFIFKSGLYGFGDFGLNTSRATTSNVQNELSKGERRGLEKTKEYVKNVLSNPMIGSKNTTNRLLDSTINVSRAMANEDASGLYKTKAVIQELKELPMGVVRDSLPSKTLGGMIQLAGAKNNKLDDKAENLNKMINLAHDYLNEKYEQEAEGRGKLVRTLGSGARSATNTAASAGLGLITKNPTLGLAAMGWGAEGGRIKEKLDEENYGFAEKYGGENGNIDINHRKIKKNEDGSISTEKSITIGVDIDGKEKQIVIPTIIDGQEVSEEEAIKHFEETGEFLGAFDNENDAERFAEALHQRQDKYYNGGALQEAIDAGDTAMTVEIIGEKLIGGVAFGGSLLGGLTDKITKKIGNEVVRFLVKQGFDIGEEIAEEQFTNLLDGIELTGDDEKAEMADLINYLKQSSGQISAETAISTIILKLITFGYLGDIQEARTRNDLKSVVNKADLTKTQKKALNTKINSGEVLNVTELGEALQEYNQKNGITKEISDEEVKKRVISKKRSPKIQNGGLLLGNQQTIREEVKTPENATSSKIEEKSKNIGVHYGDLGKGRDTTYASMSSGHRSTGHFGTGTYFFSERASESESAKRFQKDKPRHEIDFSDYNLYKPKFRAEELHDDLKTINNYETIRILSDEDIKELQHLAEDIPDTQEIINYLDKHHIEHDNLENFESEDSFRKYLEDTVKKLYEDSDSQNYYVSKAIKSLKRMFVEDEGISEEKFNQALEKVEQVATEYSKDNWYVHSERAEDSLSTVFMKALGYEGIDVRGWESVDNSSYGSVIYDLKDNVDINQNIDYNNLSDKEIDNEFRRIQKESRAKSYESVRQQGESTINNEGLRKRLSGIFTRELERRGYNTSSNKSLSLKSDKGTTFDMYEDVDAETFHDIFEVAKKYTANGELVDLHEIKSNPEEGEIGYEDTKNYLSSDGLSGFAITKDGDLISVFNASNKKGFLSSIAEIVKKEAKTLDCYASPNQNLQEMYQKKFGFKTAAIMDYSMDYDHDDIAKNHNNPQVAFMVNTDQDVETKTFTDYDEAKKYQESFINNNESTQDEGSFIVPENTKANETTIEEEWEKLKEEAKLPEGRVKGRKHAKTLSEQDYLSRKTRNAAAKRYDLQGYIPVSNEKSMGEANKFIEDNGMDGAYKYIKGKFNSNERIKLVDEATCERLVQMYDAKGQEASKAGQKALAKKYYSIASELAEMNEIFLTESGQIIQAASMIKRMSPEGQISVLKKMIKRTNIKEGTNIKLTQDQENRIKEAGNNQKKLEDAVSSVTLELANQIPPTTGDKLRAWRYLSMLGNFRTHNRNIVGNLAMHFIQKAKNKVAGAGEGIVSLFYKDLERTKTFWGADKNQKQFAKDDAKLMSAKMEDDKYTGDKLLKKGRKTFNDKWFGGWLLEKATKGNSWLLEKEDQIFFEWAYRDAMAGYMKANNLSAQNMEDDATLSKARKYAVRQAEEATFHQFSDLANQLNQIEQRGGLAGFLTESVVPFKKTPINIAKTGVAYTPLSVARSIGGTILDINKTHNTLQTQLDNGTITQAEYNTQVSNMVNERIDQMAKGLTGTSIFAIGYKLAQMGILKGSNRDKEDEFEDSLGLQDFSIKIGDNTYSLEWLAPSAIPLFVGVNTYDLLHSVKDADDDEDFGKKLERKINAYATGITQALEPMTEMSMLQGLVRAISSNESESSGKIFDMATGAVSGYLSQYNPTLFRQISKTLDTKVRDTTSTKKGLMKKIDEFYKQQILQTYNPNALPVKTNIWGEEQTKADSLVQRAAEVGITPWNREEIVEDLTDEKLLELFREANTNVLPNAKPDKTIKFDGKPYTMTNKEYNQFKKTYGKIAKDTLKNLLNSDKFNAIEDPEERANMVNQVYEIAREQAKVDFANERKIDYSSDNKKALDKYNGYKLLTGNGDTTNYFIFKSKNFDAKDENGETVNGLKKKRTETYLDMAGISEAENLYLKGMNYKLKEDEKQRFMQLLLEKQLSFEDMSMILNNLKNK